MLAKRNLRYTRGDWLLVCGPCAAVLLPPGVATGAATEQIWHAVGQQSLSELMQTLSTLGLDGFERQAVLTWDDEQVHIMLRGEINVIDAVSGHVVASGAVGQWFESSLHEQQIAVKLDSETGFEMPLVAGAALVSSFGVGVTQAAPVGVEKTEVLDLMAPYAPGQDAVETSPLGTFNEVDKLFQAAWQPNPSLGAGWGADASKQTPKIAQPVQPEPRDPQPEPIQVEQVVEEIPAVSDNLLEDLPEDPEPFYEEAPVDAPEPVMPAPAKPREKKFVLRAPDGVLHVIERLTLVGRAPHGDDDPQIIRVQSPNQDISRTHLSVRPAAGGIEVTDEHSTNGTIITMPDGNRYSLTPGSATFVQEGTRIDLGDGQVLDVLTQ